MDKKELRNIIRAKKRQFTSSQLAELSLSAMHRLLNDDAIKNAKVIMMYYSLADEVDTHQTIDILAKEGKTVLLPVVTDGENMELRIYKNPSDMKAGAYGIMEPAGELFTGYEKIDVVVVPGMSFDKQGNRLGRGKGYYDRFLTRIGSVYKIGICFGFQISEDIPTERNDIKMDSVIY